MTVNIDEIQRITSLLLSKLKENKGNEINNDYYWDIINEELFINMEHCFTNEQLSVENESAAPSMAIRT